MVITFVRDMEQQNSRCGICQKREWTCIGCGYVLPWDHLSEAKIAGICFCCQHNFLCLKCWYDHRDCLFWQTKFGTDRIVYMDADVTEVFLVHDSQVVEKKQREFSTRSDVPKLFSIWQHYKGGIYRVEGFVMRESNEEMEVCYKDLVNHHLLYPWSRPLSDWNQVIKYKDRSVKRFTEMNKMGTLERDFLLTKISSP